MSESQSFDLRHYAEPSDSYPKVLWRVTQYHSQSRRDKATGELHAASDVPIDDEEHLTEVAAKHFNWHCNEPSPFLSAFADEEHARRFANTQNRKKSPVYITQVITAMLPPDVYLFKALTLCDKLGIKHPYQKDEFVFLHRIPWQALGQRRDLLDQPKDNDAGSTTKLNSMVKRIGEANDTFAKYIAFTEDSSIAYAIRNLAGDMEEHHQALVRAMAEVIIDDAQEGREPDNKADSSTQDPFSEAYRLLSQHRVEDEVKRGRNNMRERNLPLKVTLGEPLASLSSLEVAQGEIAKTLGSQPMGQLEGVGKRRAAVASSPAEEPGIPDVGRLTL